MAEAEYKQKKNISKSFVSGRLVPIDWLRRYMGVLILIMLLLIGYIANKFNCQMDMENIKQLKSELARVKTDYVNASASYYSRVRETEMTRLVDSFNLGLEAPEQPPYKLEEK